MGSGAGEVENVRGTLSAIQRLGSAVAATALTVGSRISALRVGEEQMTANAGTDPYPIPRLDKNGSHNQPAGPKPGAVAYLPFQGTRGEVQHIYGNGNCQSRQLDRVWQSEDGLQPHAGRTLDGASGAPRLFTHICLTSCRGPAV